MGTKHCTQTATVDAHVFEHSQHSHSSSTVSVFQRQRSFSHSFNSLLTSYSVFLRGGECYLHLPEWIDSVLRLRPYSQWKFHYCSFYFSHQLLKQFSLIKWPCGHYYSVESQFKPCCAGMSAALKIHFSKYQQTFLYNCKLNISYLKTLT